MKANTTELPASPAKETTMKQQILDAIRAVYDRVPLVHNITNFVVMQFSANTLLAAHASPLMAHAAEEMDDLTDLDSALVLNIGTLDPAWLDSMELAGRLMKSKGKPVVLDPVGAGASRLRTEAALRLLDMVRPDILRGNASEIMALAAEILFADKTETQGKITTRGVDSRNGSEEALDPARLLARRFHCVVSISGEQDFITNGDKVLAVRGGSPLMPLVTGMGCSASAVTGAYAAVCKDSLVAAAAAMAVMASAGEKAGRVVRGPGSFLPAFLDELHLLDPEDAAERVSTLIEKM